MRRLAAVGSGLIDRKLIGIRVAEAMLRDFRFEQGCCGLE
jgi:hypothetical protein